MLTITDVPENILELYQKTKIPVHKIIDRISADHTSVKFSDNENLCDRLPDSVVYVRSGIFKYTFNGKFIRYYSTGDLIATPEAGQKSVVIESEFGADVMSLPRAEFQEKLKDDFELFDIWSTYQVNQNHIMHALCSLYAEDDFKPHFDLRQYNAGDVIVGEGDGPDNLFIMLEGEADVTIGGTLIGAVNKEEAFGEISFLTGATRSATVRAKTTCLVQAIPGKDFEKFSKHRPALIYQVARTLARRLTEVNRRLVAISSIT